MRGTLLLLVLGGAVVGGDAKTDAPAPTPDLELLRKAGVKSAGDSLLVFFRKRTLPEAERPPIAKLVRQLGSEVCDEAEAAAAGLSLRGPLADPDAQVRYRVAQALAYAGEPSAVAALIDTLPDLPLSLGWQAEEFLFRLAGPVTPPTVAMGNDPITRRKCRDGWQSWWKTHAAKVDLAKLEEPAKLQGNTLIVLLDEGRVLELGPNNQVRWSITNLSFPLDAQLIGDDRVLIAEYYGNRVTERDLK